MCFKMSSAASWSDPSPEKSSSAEAIAEDDDLLMEILLFLPAKPLIRFKSVSRRWRLLISNPYFCSRHSRRIFKPSSVSGIFLRRTSGLNSEFEFVSLDNISTAPFRSLNFAGDPVGIKILQSCNGLLCCCSARKIGRNNRSYYIYNPTTKQSVTLPSLSLNSTTIFGMILAYDPWKSPDYRVVCVRSSARSIYYYQVEIYLSETKIWRVVADHFTAPFDMVFDNGVFWNGAIHWLSPTGASLYFNIEEERFGAMPVLPSVQGWGKRRMRNFGEASGHLYLIEIYGSSTSQFKVFELASDYSKWNVKYHVDLDGITTAFPEVVRQYPDPCDLNFNYYAFFLLFIIQHENECDSSLLLHVPGKIVSYNFKDSSFNKICDLLPSENNGKGSPQPQYGWLDAYQYIATLSCV